MIHHHQFIIIFEWKVLPQKDFLHSMIFNYSTIILSIGLHIWVNDCLFNLVRYSSIYIFLYNFLVFLKKIIILKIKIFDNILKLFNGLINSIGSSNIEMKCSHKHEQLKMRMINELESFEKLVDKILKLFFLNSFIDL